MLRSYATHHQLIIQHALEATERINYFTAPAQDHTEKKETHLPPHFHNNPGRKKFQTHPGFATSFHKDSPGKRFIRCATVPPAGLLLRVAALTAVTRLMKSWPVDWQWLIWGGGEREYATSYPPAYWNVYAPSTQATLRAPSAISAPNK